MLKKRWFNSLEVHKEKKWSLRFRDTEVLGSTQEEVLEQGYWLVIKELDAAERKLRMLTFASDKLEQIKTVLNIT